MQNKLSTLETKYKKTKFGYEKNLFKKTNIATLPLIPSVLCLKKIIAINN